MPTPKQIAANRRNAQKSCGPKSAETKAKVAQNGVKHGLCARFRVLEEVEKQENFYMFLNKLIEDEQPVGQAEIELVVKMAEHTWLSKRALRLQNNCFALQPKTPEQAKNSQTSVAVEITYLNHYVRYHAAHDRAYQRASAELQKRKKARQLEEIGFASQQQKRAQEARAEAEETRRAEKHSIYMANALAKILPPNGADDPFLSSALELPIAAPHPTSPEKDGE